MARENDDDLRHSEDVADSTSAEKTEKIEKVEREPREEKDDKPRDIRSTIKAAIKEHSAPKRGRPPKQAGDDDGAEPKDVATKPDAPSGDKEFPKQGKPDGTESTAQPQAEAVEPAPAALSKELRSQWDKLDPVVRKEFLRREADTAKGVEQLKAKYQPYDEAFAPLRDELRSLGKTEAEGLRMLVDWRRALSGPNKVQAFAALARAENIDLRQFIQPGSTGQAGQTPNAPNPADVLRPILDPVTQRLAMIETDLQRRDRERVNADIQVFSKDKPHFEKVRVAMGHLLNSGLIQASSPQEAFNEAYQRACRMDPEVFSELQREEQAKRDEEMRKAQEDAAKKAAEAEAERKRKDAEAVERARKAGISPRGSSPSGMASGKAAQGQSVRDSLAAALKEHRSQI